MLSQEVRGRQSSKLRWILERRREMFARQMLKEICDDVKATCAFWGFLTFAEGTLTFRKTKDRLSGFSQETWYWQGDSSSDAVVMSGVRCSGTELTLDQCLHHGSHIDCPKGGGRFAAGVSCTLSKRTQEK